MPEQTTAPDYQCYAVGLIYASVCTSLSDEDAASRLNVDQPTGIAGDWVIARGESFANGQPNPSPCDQAPDTNRHILFHC